MDPGPLTLRELLWMADGRSEATWSQTAVLAAAIWTANGNLKRPRSFHPDEFNPHGGRVRASGTRITADNIDALKSALLGPRPAKTTDKNKEK